MSNGLNNSFNSGLKPQVAPTGYMQSSIPGPYGTSFMIHKLMNEVMKEIGHIGKDQKNSAQGFKFRGIDQFVNTLYPALCKHGVFMTTEVVSHNSEIREVERSNGKKGVDKHVHLVMKYTFHAPDGSTVSSTVASEGLDSGDKATNKALSAALKYALIQTFSIPTEDMAEGDSESPEIGTSKASVTTQETLPSTETDTTTAVPTIKSTFRKPKTEKDSPGGGWR